MKSLIVLCALFAVSLATFSEKEYQDAFTNWMRSYQKTFHHGDFQARYSIFKQNMDFVTASNAQNNGMTLKLNKFADMNSREFAKYYLGLKMPVNQQISTMEVEPNTALPATWDWNAKGAVTPIKNQQQCGSCWAFSTTGSTEGCHFISKGALVGLSEQNLMDCSFPQGNQGCNGGLMTQAMQYIISNNGIDTEASYPYTAEDGTSCEYVASNSGATLSGFTNVVTGSESDLQTKAYSGPVSVAIDASQNSFQFYSSGVYYEPACSSTQLDHGVLVAGWGTSQGTAYWQVKNSWGTDWGQNGWIWMSRNRQNNCGIATMATLPQC